MKIPKYGVFERKPFNRQITGQYYFIGSIKQKTNKETKMSKVKVSKKAQNELIKIMASKQNSKAKLNAGQLREAAKMALESVLELSAKSQAEIAAAMIRSV